MGVRERSRWLIGPAVLVGIACLVAISSPVRSWIAALGIAGNQTDEEIRQVCLDPLLGSGPLPLPHLAVNAHRIEVGDDVQQALDQVGEHGTVVLASGEHKGQSTRPLTGQTILGEPGAVMNGIGVPYAFRSSARNVTIQGLVIRGFQPDEKSGAVHGEEGAQAWVIRGNEIKENGEIGIVAKADWIVSDNRIHHNGRYGLTGSGRGLQVQGNEIACNALKLGSTSESAATKFVHTVNLVLRENYVHDNLGNGLWVDINNLDAEIRSNRVEGNALAGVFIEISCGGLIVDNEVTGNGFGTKRPDGMNNAGIFVANSPGVQIMDNRVLDNAKGIGGLHWPHGNRDAVDRCVPELRDLKVIGNVIRQHAGLVAGIDATVDRADVWANWGNGFLENDYDLSASSRFKWEGDEIDLGSWRALGLD